jgi:hypothetical protein
MGTNPGVGSSKDAEEQPESPHRCGRKGGKKFRKKFLKNPENFSKKFPE